MTCAGGRSHGGCLLSNMSAGLPMSSNVLMEIFLHRLNPATGYWAEKFDSRHVATWQRKASRSLLQRLTLRPTALKLEDRQAPVCFLACGLCSACFQNIFTWRFRMVFPCRNEPLGILGTWRWEPFTCDYDRGTNMIYHLCIMVRCSVLGTRIVCLAIHQENSVSPFVIPKKTSRKALRSYGL